MMSFLKAPHPTEVAKRFYDEKPLASCMSHCTDAEQIAKYREGKIRGTTKEPCGYIGVGRAETGRNLGGKEINGKPNLPQEDQDINSYLLKRRYHKSDGENTQLRCSTMEDSTKEELASSYDKRRNSEHLPKFTRKNDWFYENTHTVNAKNWRINERHAHLVNCREIGGNAVFNEQNVERYKVCDSYRKEVCYCQQKRVPRMTSCKVNTAEKDCIKLSMPWGLQPAGVQGPEQFRKSSTIRFDHEDFEQKLGDMMTNVTISDIKLKTGYGEVEKRAFEKRQTNCQQLFSLHSNQGEMGASSTGDFLGLLSLRRKEDSDLSFCLSSTGQFPSLCVRTGLSKPHVLTVVRRTGTGLEIERRASAELVRIPEICENRKWNSCAEHDQRRVKNRTISWVNSQRLLQSRIKV